MVVIFCVCLLSRLRKHKFLFKPRNHCSTLNLGEHETYMKRLDELINDTQNTILVHYFKMYFIGSSGTGKTTTMRRLTRIIANIVSLPEEERKHFSTYLAECTQMLATMDYSGSKLEFKIAESLDEETQMLFAYLYSSKILPLPVTPGTLASTLDQPINRSENSNTQERPFIESKSVIQNESQVTLPSQDREIVNVREDYVSKVITRLRFIVGSGKYTEQLLDKILINVIDVGGQPGFLEMLPFLSKGPGMFLAFFRLDKGLDEPCEILYERGDNKISPYKAVYTIRETLSQILSAISYHVSLDSDDQEFSAELTNYTSFKPVAMLVGTFKDELEKKIKTETIQTNSSSKKMLKQKLDDKNSSIMSVTDNFGDLLIHPEGMHFFDVDNFNGTDTDLDPLRSHIHSVFQTRFNQSQLRIRPSQLLLGVVIRKEYDIVSIKDCVLIGRELSMDEDEVKFAIWYLDRWIGALIYHPEIEDDWFKQNIICSPQVIFDSTSSLIVESLLELHGPQKSSSSEEKFKNSAEKGLVLSNIFSQEEKSYWTKKGLFSIETVKFCHSIE